MNRLLIIALMAFVLAACNEADIPTEPGSNTNTVDLYLFPTAGVSVGASARWAATGSPLGTVTDAIREKYPFPLTSGSSVNRSALGVCIYPAGTDFLTVNDYYIFPGYHNIKGIGSRDATGATADVPVNYASHWSFLPQGGTVATKDKIGLATSAISEGAVDIYGYYPYMDDVDKNNITAYPFTVETVDSLNFDFMYTGLIPVDPNAGGSTDLYPAFRFYHAMPVLEFRMLTSYAGLLKIDRIELTATSKASPGTPLNVFADKGTIDLTTGAINTSGATFSNTFSIDYKRTIVRYVNTTTVPTLCNMVFPQILSTDALIEVKLVFADPNDPSGERPIIGKINPLIIDLSNAEYMGGLKNNHKYVFGVRIDNYIKYEGYAEINTTWDEGPVTDIEF